jgi:hypothetical protein
LRHRKAAAPAHRGGDAGRPGYKLAERQDNPRATTPAPGRKPVSDDALRRFSDAAGGAFDAIIIDQPKMLAIAAAAMSGSSGDRAYATAILRCIEHWLAEVAERGKPQHCLSCGAQFRAPRAPAAFAVLTPMFNPGARATVSGICPTCYATAPTDADRLALALTFWRNIWPDMRAVEGEHA